MDYLIRNASIINEGKILQADVLVSDGLISKIGSGIEAGSAKAIDATGKYLIPGIIDEHVHFREPGMTHKADIRSESRAAVAGGVTSFMDMPNTIPQTTTQELLQQKFDIAAEHSLANYSFYIGATNDNLAEVLKTDVRNVCGIKLFMGSSTGNMLVDSDKALEALFREAPCLIAAHCEDEGIIRENTARYKALADAGEAVPDACIHPYVRPAQACYASSARAVETAVRTGARLHILHISTAEELSLFRSDIPLSEKKITAETCPHYLCLSECDYSELGFAIKCNPAIKSEKDKAALLSALRTGVIDTIGTDHAPHLKEEKMTGNYFTSKSGFPSVQHSLDLMADVAAHGWISLPEMVQLMCHNPAILYRVERRGFIREGYHADLAIVDFNCRKVISDGTEYSKCGWTPYDGRTVTTRVTHTFVSGNLVYEDGIFHDEYRGERLRFDR